MKSATHTPGAPGQEQQNASAQGEEISSAGTASSTRNDEERNESGYADEYDNYCPWE
jgi:hypothetical protein